MTLYQFIVSFITLNAVMAAIPGICSYLIYVERKIAAYVQDRIGPNRVGPLGLLQPVADGLKFLLKEEVIPDHVDKLLFVMAPGIAVATALFALAVVPWGSTTVPPAPPALAATAAQQAEYAAALENYKNTYQGSIAPNVDIGVLFVFSVTSLGVYGIILGGWASNNKYSLLGSLRSSAQLISYEIPLGLSVIGVIVMSGSLNLERVINAQAQPGLLGLGSWYAWTQPMAFLICLIGVMAECNRMPFDLPEAESELVGGYHTEYSALKFGLFFLGEYTHIVTTSLLLTVLFFGGWHFPGIAEASSTGLAGWLIKAAVLWAKTLVFIVFYMMIRWTLPRFRFDQLMSLAWKGLIPLSVVNLVMVMTVKEFNWPVWVLLPASVAVLLAATAFSVGKATGQRRAVIRPELLASLAKEPAL